MIDLHCFGSLFLSDQLSQYKTVRRKSLALLAFLHLKGGKWSRLYCASLMWPMQDEKHSLANLRNVITDINHATPEKLVLSEEDLIFVSPELESDAHLLLSLAKGLEGGKKYSYQYCLSLLEQVQGQFLSGFLIDESANFEDWYFFICSELSRALKVLRKNLILFFADEGLFDRCLEYALANREEDLLDENSHRIVMILYALQGDYGEMHHQLEYCKSVLNRESIDTIEEETEELYQQLSLSENRGHKNHLLEILFREAGISPAVISIQKQVRNRRRITLSPLWMAIFFTVSLITLTGSLWHVRRGVAIPSLSILPMEYRTDEENNPFLGDEITSRIISNVKDLDSINIRPLSSVKKYRQTSLVSSEIYKELGSAYIVKGEFHSREDLSTYNLRIIDGKTGELIRFLTGEYATENSEDLYDFLAKAIEETIYSGLSPAQRSRISAESASNDFLNPDHMAATYHLNHQLTAVEQNILFQQLKDIFQKDYYTAVHYIENSDMYWGEGFWGRLPPDGSLELMETAENLILNVKPDSPIVDLSRGVRALIYEGEIDKAEKYLSYSLHSDCCPSVIMRWLALVALCRKESHRALQYLTEAEAADPHNHLNQVYKIAVMYYHESYERVIEMVDLYQASRSSPHFVPELYKARALMALGRLNNAQEVMTRTLMLDGGDLSLAYQGYLFAITDRNDLAGEINDSLESHCFRAIVAAGQGKKNLTSRELDKARLNREVPYLWIRNDPLLFFME